MIYQGVSRKTSGLLLLFWPAIYGVKFWETLDVLCDRKTIQWTKIFSIFYKASGSHVRKVLVTKCDNPPFCNEESELVFGGVTELRQLYSVDDRPELGGEMLNFGPSWQKVAFCGISFSATLDDVVDGFVWLTEPSAIPLWEKIWIGGARSPTLMVIPEST